MRRNPPWTGYGQHVGTAVAVRLMNYVTVSFPKSGSEFNVISAQVRWEGLIEPRSEDNRSCSLKEKWPRTMTTELKRLSKLGLYKISFIFELIRSI